MVIEDLPPGVWIHLATHKDRPIDERHLGKHKHISELIFQIASQLRPRSLSSCLFIRQLAHGYTHVVSSTNVAHPDTKRIL
jgi:hypothetical protein